MKEELKDRILCAIREIVPDVRDAGMRISMILADYDVMKAERLPAVWHGDRNEQTVKRFLAAKIANGLSARTIQYYGQTIPQALRKIGKDYDEVTTDDIRLYLAQRIYKDGVSKTCANNERRNLSTFYSWLYREGIIQKNPITRVDPIKQEKKRKEAFSPMDLERIRGACRTARETAMIELLVSTWCRVSEVVQIRIDDIDEDRIVVYGKGSKERMVYLNAKAVFALNRYLAERKDDNPYLFPGKETNITGGKKGGAKWYKIPENVSLERHMDMASFEGLIRKIGKRAGVQKTHPHRFRRTGATMALRNGMAITTVSKLLGHESIDTTQIYLDVSNEDLEDAHKRFVI